MNYKQSDYVITEKKGRYGLSLKDGKKITPCVYDEIRPTGDDFTCRIWKNWDRVEIENGEVFFSVRVNFCNNRPVTIADLKLYDAIKPEKQDGCTIIYSSGKFGIKDANDAWIVPCICDQLSKWHDAEVVEVRIGEECKYFNLQGEEILTDKPAYGDSYAENKFLSGIMQVKELTDGINDHHTYIHKMGFIRLNHISPKAFAQELRSHCEIIPMPEKAISDFLDKYSYEYSAGIITLSINDLVSKGTNLLEGLGFFENSWHYIDKMLTNENTRIKVSSFVQLRRYYEDHRIVLGGSPHFAYGIDKSLKDGEVKWINVQHYCEHCFPGYYEIGDLVCEGSLEELRKEVESIEWPEEEPYGGAFFNYGNIRYTKKRTWTETKKVLEYIGQYDFDYDYLLENSINSFYSAQFRHELYNSEAYFYLRCIIWALKRGANPNSKIEDGETLLDKLKPLKLKNTAASSFKITKEAFLVLHQYGALTIEELRQKEDDLIKGMDSYDYSLINKENEKTKQ
jgi:hypothetical protein